MKIFLQNLFLSLLLLPFWGKTQQTVQGRVLNTKDKSPIVATIALSNGMASTGSDLKGYFNLKNIVETSKDTLVFSAIGYQPLRISIADFRKQPVTLMTELVALLNEVTITKKRLKTIVIFDNSYTKIAMAPVAHFAIPHINTNTYKTEYIGNRAIARADYFVSPNTDAKLLEVNIKMLIPHYPERAYVKHYKSKYLLHLLQPDSLQRPGRIIFTKLVQSNGQNGTETIDLSNDGIYPGKAYFVAVEWLPIPYNVAYGLTYGKIDENNKTAVSLETPHVTPTYCPLILQYIYGDSKPKNGWELFLNLQNNVMTWRSVPSRRMALGTKMSY